MNKHLIKIIGVKNKIFCFNNFTRGFLLIILLLGFLYSEASNLTAVKSGLWTDASVWGGVTPVDGDNIIIPVGDTVTFNADVSEGDITGTLAVAGILQFDTADARAIYVNGNLSGSGTIDMSGGSGAHNIFLGGANNAITTFICGVGTTVNYNRSSAQQIFAGTYSNLTTSGSGIKTLQGNVMVNGTLTLNATLAVSTRILTLNSASAQNIQGNPSYLTTLSTSSLVYNGNTAGITIPSSVTQLSSLTINNANGVSLSANITTLTTLILTSGNLNNSTYNISMASTNSITVKSGTLSLALTSYGTTRNIIYNGTTGFTTGKELEQSLTVQVNNLSISGAAGNITLNSSVSTLNVAGTFNMSAANTFTFSNTTIQTVDVSGNFTGRTVNMSGGNLAHQLTLRGATNLIVTNLNAGTGSTVNYNRSSTITIAGSGSGGYNNLTLSGSGTKSLGATTRIYGTLNISNGLSLNAYNLTLGSSASISGTFSNTNKIVTNSSGRLIKQGTTNSNFVMTYPVGTSSEYTPFIISSISATYSGTGSLYINTAGIKHPLTTGSNNSLNRYWVVTTSNITLTNISGSFTYVDPTDLGSSIEANYTTVGRFSGTAWNTSGTGVTLDISANTINLSSATAISGEWTAGESGAFSSTTATYSIAAGAWDTPGIWSTGVVPNTSSTDVIIRHSVSSPAANRDIRDLTIVAGASLTIGAVNFTVSGATSLFGSFTDNNNSGITVFKSLVTINTGGAFTSTAVTTSGNMIFQNGISNSATFSAGSAQFNTNSQILSGANAMSFANAVYLADAFTLTNQNTNTVTITGALDGVSGSTFVNDANATLNYANATQPMNTSGSVLDANNNPNTVKYSLNGLQTVNSTTYHHLTFSGGNIKTASDNIVVNGDLNISAGTFDLGTNATTLTVGGNATIAGILSFNGTTAKTVTITGNLSGAGTVNMSGGSLLHQLNLGGATNTITTLTTAAVASNVNYIREGDQTMITSLNYREVEISGSGIKTIQGNTTINNDMAIDTGCTFALGSTTARTVNIYGNLSASYGTIDMSGGSLTHSLILRGATNSLGTLTTAAVGSIVTYSRAGVQSIIASPNYRNLTLSGSGNRNIQGDLIIGGNLTVTTAALVFGSTAYTVTVNGLLSGSGTINMTGATHTLNLAGATNTISTFTTDANASTVTYNASGAQNIFASLNYRNLSIQGSGIKTMQGNTTINNDLNIASGCTYAFISSAARTITVIGNLNATNGTIDMSGGSYTHSLLLGGATNTLGTLTTAAVASTINFNRSGDQSVFASANYRNLTVSGSGNKTIQGSVTVGGNLTVTAASLVFGSSANTVSVTGTLSGTGALDMRNATHALYLNGASNSISTLTTDANASSIYYNLNGTQNVFANTNYRNLYIQSGGTKTLSGAITVNNNLYITAGTLSDGGFQITGNAGGTMTMSAGTTIQIGSTSTATLFPTNFINSNISLNTTSTVKYNSNAAQTISGVPTYGNLNLMSTSTATKTLNAPTTINGSLIINTNNTLNDGGYQITGNASGTLSMAVTSTLTLGSTTSATSFPTNFINANISLNSGSTVIYNSNLSQNISGIPAYGNLTLTSTGAVTKTATAPITINGILTINTNNIFADGGNTITAKGNIVNNATHSGAGKIYLNGGSALHTLSGIGSYTNLELNDANGSTTSASFTVNGTLTLTSGVFTIGAYTLTLNGAPAIARTSGTLTTGSTSSVSYTNSASLTLPDNLFTSSPASLSNLTINSAGGLNLGNQSITINGTLTLTNGIFNIGNNTLSFQVGNTPISRTSGTITCGASASLIFGTLGNTGGNAFAIPSNTFTSSPVSLANFTMNRTNQLTLGNQSIILSGNLTNTAGTLADAGRTITVNGGVTMSGTHSGAGKIILNGGSGVHTLSGTGSYTNLELNDTYGAALGASCSINGVLTMTSGLFALGNNDLTLATTASISGTPGTTKMIVTNGTGQLKKTFATGISSFTFPVGETSGTTEYSPVTLSFTANATSGAVGVRVVNAKHPANPQSDNYISRYWSFTAPSLTTYTYTATFTYPVADVTGSDESLFIAQRYDNGTSAWLPDPASSTNAVTHVLTTSSLTQTTGKLNNNDFTSFINDTYFWTKASGNWNGGSSIWEISSSGTDPGVGNGIPSAVVPTYSNNKGITIRSGNNITLNAGTYSADQMTIASTGALIMNNYNFNLHNSTGSDLTIIGSISTTTGQIIAAVGSVTIDLNGTFNTSNSNGFSGGSNTSISSTNSPSITISDNSTVNYNGTDQIITAPTLSYGNLTISGSGTKSLAAATDINGNLTISAGTLDVTASNYNITLGGNFDNSASFNAHSGSVTFDGVTSIAGSSIPTFNNIIISNTLNGKSSGNFYVTGDWTNDGTYIHNNGKVTFNGNSLYKGLSTTTFYDVDIAHGKMFTIQGGGKTMHVSNKIQIMASDPHSMAQFAIEDNSSKLLGTGGSDTVYVQVYDTLNNWHYQSTPIYNGYMGAMVFKNFFGKSYNEKLNKYVSISGFDSLQAGCGYTIKYNTAKLDETKRLTTFAAPIAKLHTGTISYPVTKTNGFGDGWNLVGNPYPCSIDWDSEYGWGNTNIEPTIYLYDSQQRRYATYNSTTHIGTNGGTRYIPSMQGLYIHCTDNGFWSMDNRVRRAYNQPFWKGVENNNQNSPLYSNIFSMKVSGNGYSDESMIGFTTEATSGFDKDLDAYKLLSPDELVPQINTFTLDEKNSKVAVNFLPVELSQKSSIPLQFNVGQAGIFTISSNNGMFDPAVNVTLEDLKTGKKTDLRSSSYTFTSEAVSNDNRFLIHFGDSPTTVREKELNELITIYADLNNIFIRNKSNANDKGSITIYDLLGKEITSRELQPNSLTSIELNDKAQSVYFVRIMTNNKSFTKKICLNR